MTVSHFSNLSILPQMFAAATHAEINMMEHMAIAKMRKPKSVALSFGPPFNSASWAKDVSDAERDRELDSIDSLRFLG